MSAWLGSPLLRLALVLGCAAPMAAGCGAKTPAESGNRPSMTGGTKTPEGLTLTAGKARLEDRVLRLEATLVNGTGGPRMLRTSFASVFDGVQVELFGPGGQILTTVHYTHHQSPYTSSGRPVELATGRTTQALVVPIEDERLLAAARRGEIARIRLVGQRAFYGTPGDLHSAEVALAGRAGR